MKTSSDNSITGSNSEPSLLKKPLLIAANTAILLAAGIGCIVTGDGEFVFYLVALCVLMAIVYGVYRQVKFSDAVLWSLTVWAAAHMAGGLVVIPDGWPHASDSAVLYNFWIVPERFKYDQLVHIFGFGVTTFVCWQSMQSAFAMGGESTNSKPITPTVGKVFLAAMASCGLGAANEIVEYLATVMVPDTNVGGYVNTAHDLISNAFGASLAAAAIYIKGK